MCIAKTYAVAKVGILFHFFKDFTNRSVKKFTVILYPLNKKGKLYISLPFFEFNVLTSSLFSFCRTNDIQNTKRLRGNRVQNIVQYHGKKAK